MARQRPRRRRLHGRARRPVPPPCSSSPLGRAADLALVEVVRQRRDRGPIGPAVRGSARGGRPSARWSAPMAHHLGAVGCAAGRWCGFGGLGRALPAPPGGSRAGVRAAGEASVRWGPPLAHRPCDGGRSSTPSAPVAHHPCAVGSPPPRARRPTSAVPTPRGAGRALWAPHLRALGAPPRLPQARRAGLRGQRLRRGCGARGTVAP